MNFKDYQENAEKTAIYPEVAVVETKDTEAILTTVPFVYPVMGLAGEVGELSNKLKKVIRDNNGSIPIGDYPDYEKELGDILWYVSAVASSLKLDLNRIAELNIEKLKSRQERGVIGGAGDNR